MSGRFFEGFSGALLPYTILYTRARDGASSRPTGFSPRTMRRLIAWLEIFATNHTMRRRVQQDFYFVQGNYFFCGQKYFFVGRFEKILQGFF
jgi:hypothetical protein